MDWKYIAKTKGYKSLKAAYIKEVQKNKSHSKKVLLHKFNWVINRAKHYAYHEKRTLENVLNEWEQKRNYGWLNFYQDAQQPKYRSKKPKKHKRIIKTKTKKRWSMNYKKYMASVS